MHTVPQFNIFFPGKLVFGKGAITGVGDEVINLCCSKVIIITIEPLVTAIDCLLKKLAENKLDLY